MKWYGSLWVEARYVCRFTVITCICLSALAGTVRQSHAEMPEDWRKLSATELAQFYGKQEKQKFAEVSQEELIDHAWAGYLNNADYLDGADPADWVKLAKALARSLDDDRKQLLIDTTETVLIRDEEKLKGMSVWTVWRLRSAWSGLGATDENVYGWTRDWLVAADNWKLDAGHGEINLLLDWAVTVRNKGGYDMKAEIDEIFGYMRDKALNDPAWLKEDGTVGMKRMVLRIKGRVTPEERARVLENVQALVVEDRALFLAQDVWSMDRLREMAEPYEVEKATWDGWVLDWFTNSDTWHGSNTKQLDMLYKWLAAMEPSGEADMAMGDLGKFAAKKLADSPELDGSQWYFKSLGVLFKTEDQQAYLLSLLVDDQGMPRRNIGRVLSRVYADTDDTGAWQGFIERQVDESDDTPDRQALWLLVRAEAAAAIPSSEETGDVTAWAVRGIKAAGTDEVRLACLEWIVNDYSRTGREAEAAEVIREQATHFESDLFRSQLAELERMMAESER